VFRSSAYACGESPTAANPLTYAQKIRCDGIRPSCTQCQNVGFECKTSDKLSRRAFPRGYTESLEERVRALEAEVRDLKELLDAKEEKIDLLSRLRSHSSPQSWLTPPRTSSMASAGASPDDGSHAHAHAHSQQHLDRDDCFKLLHSPGLVDDDDATRSPSTAPSSAFFTGPSSGRALVGMLASATASRMRSMIRLTVPAQLHSSTRPAKPAESAPISSPLTS
jgi:hypothetical protein